MNSYSPVLINIGLYWMLEVRSFVVKCSKMSNHVKIRPIHLFCHIANFDHLSLNVRCVIGINVHLGILKLIIEGPYLFWFRYKYFPISDIFNTIQILTAMRGMVKIRGPRWSLNCTVPQSKAKGHSKVWDYQEPIILAMTQI